MYAAAPRARLRNGAVRGGVGKMNRCSALVASVRGGGGHASRCAILERPRRMSLWFRTRDKDGTVHYISIPFELLSFIALVGIGVALLLPFVQMFRVAVFTSPVSTSVGCGSILMVGLALFALAKFSVIGTGRLVSFGPRKMSRTMRAFYYVGYIWLVIGTTAILLFVAAAASG